MMQHMRVTLRNGDCIGLYLFNVDTRPSGHISHPTQVNMLHNYFESLNKLFKPDYIITLLFIL